MIFVLLSMILVSVDLFLECDAKPDGSEMALIPYLDEDILGINRNDLDEDDDDLLPHCDVTTLDPKMMKWRLQSDSQTVFLDYDKCLELGRWSSAGYIYWGVVLPWEVALTTSRYGAVFVEPDIEPTCIGWRMIYLEQIYTIEQSHNHTCDS